MSVKEAIANRKPEVTVTVPELGEVTIRRLSVREYLALPEGKGYGAALIKTCVVEEGKPVFETVAEVEALDAGMVFALASACKKANTLSAE